MRFVDLFAGLGGFRLALNRLGHTCVFACEVDGDLSKLYKKNFGVTPYGDIRKVAVKDIPAHDILCAGFPCQPFSKAGGQRGLKCPSWGDLIEYVIKIVRYHMPHYFILENVPNLLEHDEGRTWKEIKKSLERDNLYGVDANVLSPHKFGVPQIRHRVFIVGRKGGLRRFSWPTSTSSKEPSVQAVLDNKPSNARKLNAQVVQCLNVWQDFLKNYPKHEALPTFPIWSMEFGANYPYVKSTPYAQEKSKLQLTLASGRKALKDLTNNRSFESLPSYARTKQTRFPEWKIDFIRKNRALYRRHKKWIDRWLRKIRAFPPSLQKLEWNCNNGERNIWKYIIQFRASGVRVKKRTSAPSLVAMTTTQVPIVAWERRYMTPRECARLQSLIGLRHLPKQSRKAFKALGNAVNAHLVELIAANLLVQTARIRKTGKASRQLDKPTSENPLYRRARMAKHKV